MKTTLTIPLALSCVVASLTYSTAAIAHGYISQPASRSQQCAQGVNTDCGAIQWEPQSVEGPDGYPDAGPADGRIASAGNSHFSELDVQTAARWSSTSVQQGDFDISWHFTANHRTRDWRYYLTRPDWNPNLPLSRSSFDRKPFCVIDGRDDRPPVDDTHRCTLPDDRTGYHVMLGVWDVGDTANAFYQAVDLNIQATPSDSDWVDVGDIQPTTDLNPGDRVRLRVFDDRGEMPDLSVDWTVDTAANGARDVWPLRLAETVNARSSLLRAGVLEGDTITPVTGKNDVFVPEGSLISRVETETVSQPDPVEFSINGLLDRYDIVDGRALVSFTLTSQDALSIRAEVFDDNDRGVVDVEDTLDGRLDVSLTIDPAQSGPFQLVVIARNDSGQTAQYTRSFELYRADTPGDYDFVFPDGLESYQGGTRVLARDGRVYECKPYPYEGWCRVYSDNATQYAPGVGSHWRDAWVRLSPYRSGNRLLDEPLFPAVAVKDRNVPAGWNENPS